ncbi:hypothetical protein NP493_654g00000 [Ridgeia piscesae]|uniref:lysozyme n=1 Tax=Ridgeia piscesae TaxID=27915 RepID=A0AAD9NN77_RIDPI|nr:hypothetical protein NP493_654g00000 [Ridgeia piscesae]
MTVVAIAVLLCFSALGISVSAGPSANCLDCMCQAYGCNNKCEGGGCGWYRITWAYWADCGRPGPSFWGCYSNRACSRQCVVAYMKRYDVPPHTCEIYARIHMGGPNGMWTWRATNFWTKVNACCMKTGGC